MLQVDLLQRQRSEAFWGLLKPLACEPKILLTNFSKAQLRFQTTFFDAPNVGLKLSESAT
jgi:hypothetical protein